MIKPVILCLISPLLLVQGLWVRRKAIRLPEAIGERAGVSGNGQALKLLILGDSAAAGVGVEKQESALAGQIVARLSRLFQLTWLLEAKTGRTTYETISVLHNLDAEKFDVVLISLGVNDVTSGISVNQWLSHCDEVVRVLKNKFSAKRVVWSDLPSMEKFTGLPQPLRWAIGIRKDKLRAALSDWVVHQADVELLVFPDVFGNSRIEIKDWIASDGYHPGEKVYALWAQTAFEFIQSQPIISGDLDTGVLPKEFV